MKLIGRKSDIKAENEQLKRDLSGSKAEKEQMEQQRNSLVKERDELKFYLQNSTQGLEEEVNFLSFRNEQLSSLHDKVVADKWGNDHKYSKWVCEYPFTRMEILERGEVYSCCSAYVKHNFYHGNAYNDTFERIWNSDNAKKLRYSVAVGDYEYCNSSCMVLNVPRSNGDDTPFVSHELFQPKYETWKDCTAESTPKEIALTCDPTCNLTCPSCRSCIKAVGKDESQKIYAMLQEFVRPALKNCELMTAIGSGEFFASKALTDFYKTLSKTEFPKLKLNINTNGQLMTAANWEKFSNLDGMVDCIVISIDAAKKDSYEKLRCGGRWEVLCDNLEYISSLKKSGCVNHIHFRFLVQLENYSQIAEFVELAHQYSADQIFFQRLDNWGTYSPSEFVKLDVAHPENPCCQEVKKQLFEAQEIADNYGGIRVLSNVFERNL